MKSHLVANTVVEKMRNSLNMNDAGVCEINGVLLVVDCDKQPLKQQTDTKQNTVYWVSLGFLCSFLSAFRFQGSGQTVILV
jgi:hypothetical protein